MKILFLTLAKIDDIEQSGIYPDLLRKFRKENHEVTIVCPHERRFGLPTRLIEKNGVKILNVWSPNIQKTNTFEKGITTVIIEYLFLHGIKKRLKYIDFDLILYSTPPITFTNLIIKLKKLSGAKTYLLLKDIFPQNAVDLSLINSKSIIYKYFRRKEKLLYKISDYIGCMSAANLEYILINNNEISINKIEINPNSIEIKLDTNLINFKNSIFIKYNIPTNKIIFLFGGNLGIPQGINYLKKNIQNCVSISEIYFLIIGDGTEFFEIYNWIKNENILNAKIIKEIPKIDYDQITQYSQVGLIFLNPKFTIPNFPSRVLSYMQNKLPIICATDSTTDIGTIASNNDFGFSCLTSDYDSFFNFAVKLLDNKLREKMGDNSYKYLIKEYNVEISYKKIIDKFN